MKIILIFIFLLGLRAQAYPEFIGFGYRNCMICHENSSGGGALTDYARAVFASEIAGNPFSLKSEESAGISNFLGSVEFPWWVRMGFKYRSLTVERNPGSASSSKLYYNMQNDLNINFFANKAHTLALINTVGYLNNPLGMAPNKSISGSPHVFMKEYFIKYKLLKELWLQFGFMDKVFGIKTPNHTAVNRAQLGLGSNDQVHALQLQWIRANEEFFFQSWFGNLHLSKPDQLSGASLVLEKKWGDSNAYGLGALSEKKDSYTQNIFEIHNKMGFGNGNSLLMELGRRESKQNLGLAIAEKKTHYGFMQGNLNLVRGLYFLSGLEFSKNDTGSSALELIKWDLGFLAFPIQRLELRFSGVNQKTFNATEAVKDTWLIQSQIHLSL